MVSFPNQRLVHRVAGEWQCSSLESNRETLREPTCGGKESEEEEGERGGGAWGAKTANLTTSGISPPRLMKIFC